MPSDTTTSPSSTTYIFLDIGRVEGRAAEKQIGETEPELIRRTGLEALQAPHAHPRVAWGVGRGSRVESGDVHGPLLQRRVEHDALRRAGDDRPVGLRRAGERVDIGGQH